MLLFYSLLSLFLGSIQSFSHSKVFLFFKLWLPQKRWKRSKDFSVSTFVDRRWAKEIFKKSSRKCDFALLQFSSPILFKLYYHFRHPIPVMDHQLSLTLGPENTVVTLNVGEEPLVSSLIGLSSVPSFPTWVK